jgi:hypothetical protein
MWNKTKNIRWAVTVGFVFAAFSVCLPYLFNSNYVNAAKSHPGIQWLFLWLITSIAIFCIDSMGRTLKIQIPPTN